MEREKAGQVASIGPPSSGKAQMVCRLTHAHPDIADYPFTTRMPTPGMMLYENVQIQLVDTPPMSSEFMEPWMQQAI
ncbi:MAG: 50S ribosome-binding GTPase [Candidatus Solibacter sp.]|nr:50S ribosome-binding GTPase [Candidatus Solibacter sp.]